MWEEVLNKNGNEQELSPLVRDWAQKNPPTTFHKSVEQLDFSFQVKVFAQTIIMRRSGSYFAGFIYPKPLRIAWVEDPLGISNNSCWVSASLWTGVRVEDDDCKTLPEYPQASAVWHLQSLHSWDPMSLRTQLLGAMIFCRNTPLECRNIFSPVQLWPGS